MRTKCEEFVKVQALLKDRENIMNDAMNLILLNNGHRRRKDHQLAEALQETELLRNYKMQAKSCESLY